IFALAAARLVLGLRPLVLLLLLLILIFDGTALRLRLLLILVLVAAVLLLILVFLILLLRRWRWYLFRMLFQTLDLLPDLLQIRFGRFVLRIQPLSGYIMRRRIGEILWRVDVRLVHVGAIFESPAKIKMAVLLKCFVG